jgi:hypothetical protein
MCVCVCVCVCGYIHPHILSSLTVLITFQFYYEDKVRNRGSSVSIVNVLRTGTTGVKIPGKGNNATSLRHSVQTGSGAHPTSHPVGTGVSYPGIK